MYYKVKEVSGLVGLSVRMLHHYDKINLLKPDHLTDAGYRQYSDDDLSRLQQILFLRELDFSLEAIKTMLDQPHETYDALLDQQKHLLELKVQRLLRIIDTIDLTKERNLRGEMMTNNEKFKGFDFEEIQAHKAKYAKEVKERWGDSDAYQQSAKRTANYGPEDYKRIQKETDAIYEELVKGMTNEVSDPQVQGYVGQLRRSITDNYYDCTLEIFEGLGLMYVADERFAKNLNKYGEGFAAYLSEAIAYYVNHQ